MPQKNKHIEILDSTLRDGAQGESISFSVGDKLSIAAELDRLGVEYIEAGNPSSNPKDIEFFEKAKTAPFFHKLVAFGSTRHKDCDCHADAAIASLIDAGTECVSIFGKTAASHVKDVLNVSLEENLEMIRQTCSFLHSAGKRVFFDAEHFFDGFLENPDYAMQCLGAAVHGGAEKLILCDTAGGNLPDVIGEICRKVCSVFPENVIGIHCHNDCSLAVANSIAAVKNGITHVQGTLLGIGERCGNTSLSSLLPTLQIKLGYSVLENDSLSILTPVARSVAETCNTSIKRGEPYIGVSAFAHKAGMHVDAVLKRTDTFEHIAPELVGNERRILLSEIAGRSAILDKIQKIMPGVSRDSEETRAIIEKLKNREHRGYQFEGAEASFELLVRRGMPDWKPFFELVKYRVTSERPYEAGCSALASVKVRVGDEDVLRCAEGDGPVNALDKALRRSLEVFYPVLQHMYLSDYKVRVMDAHEATASMVRVLITSTDGERIWTTVGVSADIMEASFKALCDSVEYKLIYS